MALPKRRHSNTRTRKRRTHQKLSLPTLTRCGNCQTMHLRHNTCHSCGYYQGRKVDHTVKVKERKRSEQS